MKKDKENKELLQVGQKARAGQVLSEYLRAIGIEHTEVQVIFTDPDTGEPRIISKAEALARDIWEQALKGEDGKLKLEYRKMLIDRIEGRPAIAVGEEGPRRMDIPNKISEKGKKRLNQMIKNEGG